MTKNSAMERAYPINEFIPLHDLIKNHWPGLNQVTASTWCKSGKYPHAIKRGKVWFVHPEQFKQWFRDGES